MSIILLEVEKHFIRCHFDLKDGQVDFKQPLEEILEVVVFASLFEIFSRIARFFLIFNLYFEKNKIGENL